MTNIGPVSGGKLEALKAINDALDGEFRLRGKLIRVDAEGFVSLNDIHRAAGYRENKRPAEWQRLPSTNPLIIATYERVVGKSHKGTFRTSAVYRAATATGTWAHPILAAAYAGYLKPELEVEMREVWLRYRAADATLADEILQRANTEQNEWAGVRALGRSTRNEYTKALSEHGVQGGGFAACTDAIYTTLMDGTARQLRERKGVPQKANLRDAMSKDELVFVMAAETMSRQRIEAENPFGNAPCEKATRRSTARLRAAIEDDRRDTQSTLF